MKPDPRQRVAGPLFRAIGPLMRLALRHGLLAGPNVLLTVCGRVTRIPYSTPVAMWELGDRRFVQASFGEVNWVRNLRVAREAIVRRGRHAQTYLATELPPDEAALALRAALAPMMRSRFTAPMLKRWYELDASATAVDYERAALAHPVFALVPMPSPR